MAVTYGFFNSVNGDRKYNADQMSEFFRGIVSQGVFQHLDSGLAVSAGTGLAVSVAAGRAIIQDRWIQNSAALNLTISAASETYGRKDAVVIRLDKSSRAISITVKTGTPAASPVAPSMTRNATTYEMALAYVNVAAGASSVTVTDKRSDSSVCGWAAVAQATSGEVDQMLNDMKTGFDGVTYPTPAEQVIGSDTKLQNEIIDLSALDDNSLITGWESGKCILTTTSPIDISGMTITGYRCNVIPCNANDQFIINGTGGASALLWVFTDASYNKISQSAADLVASGVQITAPVGAKFLILNDKAVIQHDCYHGTKIRSVISDNFSRINEALDVATELKIIDVWENNQYIATNTNPVTPTRIYYESYRCAVIECNAGDEFVIYGSGGATPLLWTFVDSNYGKLSAATGNISMNGESIVAPANTKYLILNDKATQKHDCYYGKIIKTDFQKCVNMLLPFDNVYWENGLYQTSTNNFYTSSTRVSFRIPFKPDFPIVLTANTGWSFYLCTWDNSDPSQASLHTETNWETKEILNSDTYYTITIKKNDNSNITPDNASGNIMIERDIFVTEIGKDISARNGDVENAIMAIKKGGKTYSSPYANGAITIAHITDVHGDTERWANYVNYVNKISPDICVNTGDICDMTPANGFFYMYNYMPKIETIVSIGNHEVAASNKAAAFANFIAPLNNLYNIGAEQNYYYVDKNGIRFIVLNVYDGDVEHDSKQWIFYTQDQINFLISALQGALTNNYPVVICAHEADQYLPADEGLNNIFNQTWDRAEIYYKDWEGCPICDLIEAFINGESINQSYTENGANGDVTITVNTSFATSGHFVTWLVGHRHADHIGFLPGYSQLCITLTNGYCSRTGAINSGGAWSDLPRYEDTRSEDAFNLYVINTDEKKIGIGRIGSNMTYELTERNYTYVSYVTP